MIRLLFATFLLLLTSLALADESQLNDMERALIDNQKSSAPAFNSTPVNHITPQFNKVTLAFDSEIINTTVENSSLPSNTSESLTLGGYSFTPYLALSLRNIGVGISGEIGQKSATYKTGVRSSSSFSGYTEESHLDYTGIGVYFYYTLFKKSKKFQLNLIGGTKLLNVKHQARVSLQDSLSAAESSSSSFDTLKYTVQKMELGLNFRLQLTRDFALVPWADISIPNTNQIDDQIKLVPGQQYSSTVRYPRRYAADVELFWRNRSELIYGIDVAVKYKRLEFHIGSAIGYLSNLNSSEKEENDYTIDDSLTLNLGLSYDFKG